MAQNNVIDKFDNPIQYHETLLRSDCFKELPNFVSSCIKNQERLEKQCLEKSDECERLKYSLDNALEKVKKLASLHNDIEKDYVSLFNNYPSPEFLDFVKDRLSSTGQFDDPRIECNCAKLRRNELTEEIPTDSRFEDLIQRYEKLLQDNFAKELRDCEQCSRLKTMLQAADEELTKTNELLRAEKMFRSKFETERDSLACRVEKLELNLLRYEQHSSPADEIVAFTATTNENPTTEDMDVVMEMSLSPSPSINIANNGMAEETREPDAVSPPSIENDSFSVLEEPVLNVEIERDSLACRVEKLELRHLKYESHPSSADKLVEFPAVTNENQTTESDTLIEYESDTDWVLELSPSPSVNNVNNEMAEEIRQPDAISPLTIENDSHSVLEEPVSNAGISINNTLLSSPRTNASREHPKSGCKCDFRCESFLKKTDIRRYLQKHMMSQSSIQCEENMKLTATEKLEESSSAETVAWDQRGSKKKAKSMKGNLQKKLKTRSAPIVNDSPLHKKDSNLRCNICGKDYSSKSSLWSHKRYVHAGVKPHKCNKCNKEFAKKNDLRRHESVHSSQRLFQCSICNGSFKTAHERKRHEKFIHGDGGFYCAHCDKKFPQKCALIYHITARHLPELGKPYKCTTCSKSFIQKGNLDAHQAVHTSETSHKCSMCEKSFKSRPCKLQHERLIHNMEGFRFTCAHCERRFRQKKNLLCHIQRLHL